MHINTSKAYLNSCMRPLKLDSVKTTYLESANPKGKLTLNDMINAAIWGAIVIAATCTGCL